VGGGAPGASGLADELAAAMAAVRASPQAIEPRMALFQLACVVGQWDRARAQLDTMAQLDAELLLLSRIYGRLIDAEATRRRVFAGDEQPVALGQPPAWLAMLAQALKLDGGGDASAARELRERGRQQAAARPGTIGGTEAFAWLMDADPRLGPALEVVVEGQYRWLPLDGLEELRAEPPKAMRDLVWQPVALRLAGGNEFAAFVPTRYPGSELDDDDAIRLAKETRWIDKDGEQWGLGQRLLTTDLADHALLDIRALRFADAAVAPDA
jgi:type VI secretion system protein ImpE